MTFTKRRVLVLGILFALCGCLGYGCFVPRVSEARMKSDIDAALPIGTPRAEVEAWLGERSIKFGDIGQTDEKTGQRRIIGLMTRISATLALVWVSSLLKSALSSTSTKRTS